MNEVFWRLIPCLFEDAIQDKKQKENGRDCVCMHASSIFLLFLLGLCLQKYKEFFVFRLRTCTRKIDTYILVSCSLLITKAGLS